MEESIVDIKKIIDSFVTFRPYDPVKGTKCFKCNSENVKLWTMPLSHFSSGSLKCKDCDYSETVMKYLLRNFIIIEPIENLDDPKIPSIGINNG